MEKNAQIGIGTLVASCVFVAISFFTTGAFIMISISPFFNHYYAGIFLILGGIFLAKFHRKNKIELDQAATSKPGTGLGASVLHVPFELRKSRIIGKNENL